MFGETRALRDIEFDIAPGAVHALCGGNGSGKSTLIKILAGVYQADSGTVEINGHSHDARRTSPAWAEGSGLHFVHQAVGTFGSMTVAENFAVSSGFGARALAPVPWRRLHKRVQEVLDRFELDVSPRTSMSELAPSVQTMVAVARALQNEDVAGRGALVLDEPTASLPAAEVEAVLGAMRGYATRGHTVIFVTHRLGEILDIADSATFLRDGAHLETRVVPGLAESDLITRITGHALTPARSAAAVVDGPVRLRLRDYASGPVRGVSLDVHHGEILGITGLLGSGRSALLRGLFGVNSVRAGSAVLDNEPLAPKDVKTAVKRGVAYVPEDRSGQAALADLSVRMNVSAPDLSRYWNRIRLRRAAERQDAQTAIHRFGIKVTGPEAPFSSMSGGNQQKVVLARWLALSPRLLLLDEPTQGVDIGARNRIHAHIRDAAAGGASVLVVSSDPQELADLCHRVVGIHDGRLAGEISGDEVTVHRCTELGHGLTPTVPVVRTEEGEMSTATSAATTAVTPVSGPSPRGSRRRADRRFWLGLGERMGLPALLVVVVIACSIAYPSTFATVGNWQAIASSQSVNVVIALALMIPLLSNNFDLSVGSIAGLSTMVAAGLMSRDGMGLVESCLLVLALGVFIGSVNGLLVTRFGLNGLIATLGSATVLDAMLSWYSNNVSISSGFSQRLVDFGTATIWHVPWLTVVGLSAAAAVAYLITQTPFGRHLVAIGSSNAAARLVGIRVDRLVLTSYVISGGMASLAGILLLAQQGSATPGSNGIGILLPALAAVYLGASTWTPGQFNVVGTVLGLLFVAVTVSGLTLAGAAPWVNGAAYGGALIVAVGASAAFRRRRRGA
jgi:ABC-type sugar transport system ATPase subunit/ribose/xylose/arabinose/galactoside ABC-type transport system permease subunit